MGGRLSFPGAGHYHATKHALEAISDAMRFELRGFGIDVVLLEPGLITTDFAGAATSAMTRATSDGEDGPYARFNAAVGAITTGAYEGPTRRFGAGPERVAKVIEDAIERRHPPARIKVTASAKVTIALRRLMSDRMWDALMRRQFPQPE
jgi:short-subunit dehydrogenase